MERLAALMRVMARHATIATWLLILAVAMPSASRAEAARVITLAPHLTELVFAAGGGDHIVATVISSNFPEQARRLPHVGDGLSVNAEQLLAWQPDLVIGWQKTLAMQTLAPTLARLGIPLEYANARQLDDIPGQLEHLGRLLGTQDQAQAAAQAFRRRLTALRKTHAGQTRISVFIEIGTSPLYTFGADPLIADALDACAADNVFGDSRQPAPAVSPESVLARQPDLILIASKSVDYVAERARYWRGLRLQAALHQAVQGIDPDIIVRPGPRLIDAAQTVCGYAEQIRAGRHTHTP